MREWLRNMKREDERLIDHARRHLSAISLDARFPFDVLLFVCVSQQRQTIKFPSHLYTHTRHTSSSH